MVLSLFLLLFLAVPASAFVIETVDTTSSSGWYTSLEIDANDGLHVSYYEYSSGDLKYAKQIGGTWSIETVDAVGDVGFRTALALDSDGQAHIAYYDASTFELKYAEYSGEWVTEVIVDDALAYSNGNSPFDIDIDGQGSVHVVYQNGPFMDGKLMYARKQGGVWNFEAADSSSFDDGKSPSLIVDDDGTVHVAHLAGEFSSSTLRYVRKLAGSWVIENFGATDDDSRACALALDNAGNPHVSYYEQSPFGDLKYRRKSGGTWSNSELVDTTGNVGASNSIIVDESNRVHISASLTGVNDLKYFLKFAGTWTRQSADTAATGQWSSIALDSAGQSHISYFGGNRLRHVYGDPATGVPESERSGSLWLAAYPNPSVGLVTIRFSTPIQGLAELDVFDVAGRKIRALSSRGPSTRERSLTWDRLNASGHAVAPGTYFLRLTSSNGEQVTERVTIVR
jgi:Secretion system C-terminal sorting domain